MTEVVISKPLETVPVADFFDRAESAVRSSSYRGLPIIEVDLMPSEDERREINERSASAWREAVARLEQDKAEVIRGLLDMQSDCTFGEYEIIQRAVSLIEEVSYD